MQHYLKALLLVLFVSGIPSCCNPPEPGHYEVFIDQIRSPEVLRLMAQGGAETYQPGDTLEAEKEFLLKLDIITGEKQIAQALPASTAFLTPSAYACSPLPPFYELAHPEISLSIVSPYDYDPQHPAGADLSPLFQVMSGLDSSYQSLPAVFSEDPLAALRYFPDLRLRESPAEVSRQVFEIRLSHADTTFRARTAPVLIK